MARRHLSAIVAVVAVSWLSATAAAGPIASLRDGRVIVKLPPDWRRVDQPDLESVALWAAEVSGGRVGELWEAGFVPVDRDLELGPPFVLAQVDESGRVSHAEVSRLPSVEAVRSRVDARRDRPGGSSAVPPRLESVRFDRARYALETTSRLARSPWGAVEIRTLTYLTENGSLTLHGYLGEHADAPSRRAVSAILDGVVIADDLGYRPRLRDHWLDLSRRPAFWYGLAGLMALATAAAVRRARRPDRS